ncbi:MAG TPA: transposase [Fibrobacteraceae bacterium]|nr:transposase [Fibrobacteraceae bacterium]
MHQINDKATSRLHRIQQTVLQFEEFVNPFQARLRKDNKWVIRAGLIPWEKLEAIHEAERMSSESSATNAGRPEIPFRMAFGSLLVKELLGCTDRETVEAISENPYIRPRSHYSF